MQIEFDPAKDAANVQKHGVSLALADALDWDSLWANPDQRHDYGEVRMLGYALLDVRLYCVVFVDRSDVRRVISLRKANDREKVLYAKIFDAA